MKKLIIGCGYLGLRVARAWVKSGDEVTALTRSAANASAMREAGITPIIGDVMNLETLDCLPPVDTLLYAVGFDRSSGLSQRDVYVDGLKNVLSQVAKRVAHFTYISSTSVYGQSDGEWIDEASSTVPTRAGGEACLEAESVVWEFFSRQNSSQSANVLRLAGIYGPGRLLQRIETLKSASPLAGNPDAFLNLIHVEDATRAVLACETHARPQETYLVCDNRPIQRREYFDRLASLIGAPRPTFDVDASTTYGEPGLNKRCSNRKMRDELGLALQFPDIVTGLPHAVDCT